MIPCKSVAIIGASNKEGKVGNIILKNFIKRFKGKIFPVNPKYKEIFGLKCYPTVLDISEDIDLAVIAIPAELVPEVVKQCSEKGVKYCIIVSAGFSEIGRKDLEKKILKYKGNMKIIGPNGMGIYDPYSGIDTFFVDESRVPRPPKGKIAILSQSGAIALALMEWLALHDIGVSIIVSYGNKIDMDDVDFLKLFKEDENTKIIFMYLEGLKEGRGREFIKIAKELYEKGKRIVVLKSGKSRRGKVAISSHTASMAGEYEIYKFAFKQAKIIEAKNTEDLLIYLKTASYLIK